MVAVVIPLPAETGLPRWLSWLGHLYAPVPAGLILRGTFPLVIITLGLWILAWAERSRALAVITALYTAGAAACAARRLPRPRYARATDSQAPA